jgi:ATP-dependent RNA helicase DDX31/DBP7
MCLVCWKPFTWLVPGYLVGGEKRKAEKARLRKGITVLVGTLGRLLDHVQHTKSLHFDKVGWLVLDEADRLFDMGYEKDVARCVQDCSSCVVIVQLYQEVTLTREFTFQFHQST